MRSRSECCGRFAGQGVSAEHTADAGISCHQTINAGFTLLLTNAATDTDQPPQTLAFCLLNAPTNATLTPLKTNYAVFSWAAAREPGQHNQLNHPQSGGQRHTQPECNQQF